MAFLLRWPIHHSCNIHSTHGMAVKDTIPDYHDGLCEKPNESDDSGHASDAASRNAFEVRFRYCGCAIFWPEASDILTNLASWTSASACSVGGSFSLCHFNLLGSTAVLRPSSTALLSLASARHWLQLLWEKWPPCKNQRSRLPRTRADQPCYRDPTVGAQYRWSARFAQSLPEFWGFVQGKIVL